MSAGDGYTIKERIEDLAQTIAQQLGSIVVQLDKIERKLDDKSSNERVNAVERRLGEFEERLGRVELAAAGVAAVSTFQRWIVGGVGAAVIGSLIYVLLGAH